MDTERRSSISPDDFRTIISTSMDGFLLVDIAGNVLDANESYCQLTGYQREQLIGMHMSSVDAIDSLEVVTRRVAAIIEAKSLRFESKHRHKDGTIIDVEVSTNYSTLHGGSIFSFIRDISTQKHTREILAARLRLIEFSLMHTLSELLRQTLDEAEALTGSCIGSYHFKDPDSQMLTLQAWSTKTATRFCKTEGAGSHYPFSQAGVWADCIRDRRPVIHNDYASLPHTNGLPDGFAAVIRELLVPIFRHDNIVAIMGVGNKATDYTQQDVDVISTLADLAWDITERKQADEALKKSNENFLGLVTNIPGHVAFVNANTLQYEFVNEQYEKSFGIAPEKIIGQHVKDIIGEANFQYASKYIDEVRAGKSVSYETTFDLLSGKRWNEVTYNPILDADGLVSSIVVLSYDITERKNLEDELARQADFNRRVFNSLAANMAIIDSNGTILSVNEAWCHFARINLGVDESKWGVGADYFVKYDRKWGDTEQAQAAFDGIRKVQSGQLSHFSLEYPCQGANEQRWFLLNVVPLKGNYGSVLVSHTNITEQKQAEAGLKEAEWKFRALFENGPVGVAYHSMIYDDFGNAVDYFFIDANENYIALTGVDPRGKTVTQAFPGIENDPFDWIGTFGNVARNGETIHFEQNLQANDRWYDVVGYQYKPDHFVTSFVEITKRKKAEESLKRSQAMLARTERISHVGSWEWHIETDTVTWSDELFRIVQRDPADGAPSLEHHSEIYHPDDMKELIRVVGIAQSEGTPYQLELRAIRPNGDVRICLANGFADRGRYGKVMRLYGSLMDITEHRRFEEEKRFLEQQFQQVQKLESLGVLAGGIAHDFNNILAIIIGHCSLAEMNPDRAGEHIPIIEKAADRAAGLCHQMLAYAGKAMFTKTQVNLAVLVDEMVHMLKATTNKNIIIKSSLSAKIPAMCCDASQLRQIVMNLIINASEAIGEEQGVITVSLAKRAIKAGEPAVDHLGAPIPPGWYACLDVSDNGCGMDDETRRRIFEPFYTTKFTGRGLGMSAVLGIIKAHNGALQLVSKQGEGTTFTISLPIESSEVFGDEFSIQAVSAQWGSGTVLLVEDEIQVLQVAKAMLENMGFSVIEAANGQEALELYRKNATNISLVITDIGMPVMDGYTLFRELKLSKRDLPIIISSGFGDTVVTSRIPGEEIAGLISKPYRYDQLQEVVKAVVEGST
jgi:PAS domain S-box-containing protein